MMALTYSLRPATGFHGQLILNVGARRSGIKDSLLLTAGIIGGCPRLLHFLNSSSALARWLTAASIFAFTRAISLSRMAIRADRKSDGEGKRVSVRVDLGGGRIIKKKKNKKN